MGMPKQMGAYNCVVPFYDVGKEFDWMANTARNLPVTIDNEVWPSTEHYFHAMKYPGNTPAEKQYRDEIKKLGSQPLQSMRTFPQDVRKIASNIAGLPPFNAAAWDGHPPALDGISHEVMRKAVKAKLDQYPQHAAELDALPEDAIIVEATGNDKKWADGNDGTGTNHLGIIYKELQLERRGYDKEEAQKKAFDDYQVFNADRPANTSLYGLPDSKKQKQPVKETPKERVLTHLKWAQAIDLKVTEDKSKAGIAYGVELTFITPAAAQDFAQKSKIDPKDVKNATVTLDSVQAQELFKRSNVAMYGRRNPRPMFQALLYDHLQLTPQKTPRITPDNASDAVKAASVAISHAVRADLKRPSIAGDVEQEPIIRKGNQKGTFKFAFNDPTMAVELIEKLRAAGIDRENITCHALDNPPENFPMPPNGIIVRIEGNKMPAGIAGLDGFEDIVKNETMKILNRYFPKDASNKMEAIMAPPQPSMKMHP
jgi:N-glycosidase YbiA